MVNRLGIFCVAVSFTVVITPGLGKPGKEQNRDIPGKCTIDFSPIREAPGNLDCKITLTCRTVKGDECKRGVTIKGPATEHTAEDAAGLLRALYEAEGWDVKQIEKTKLLVAGKKGSLVAKVEVRAEGLPEKFRPTIERHQ